MEKETKRFLSYVLIGMTTGMIWFASVVYDGGTFRQKVDMFNLGENFIVKNLNLIPSQYDILNKNNYDLELNEFYLILNESYIYTSDEYDCKYWTFVWSYWAWNHRDKYNFKTITTNNHIFGMIYNDLGYCILDENNVKCYGDIGLNENYVRIK